MQLEWSTSDLPTRDRLAFWLDVHCRNLYATSPELVDRTDPFNARMTAHLSGDVGLFDLKASNTRVIRRTEADVAATNRDAFWLIVQSGDTPLHLRSGTREFDIGVGEMAIGSDETVFEMIAGEGRVDYKVCVVPKRVIEPLVPDIGALMGGLKVDGRRGAGALLLGYVQNLARCLSGMDDAEAGPLLDHVGHLAAVAAGADARSQPIAVSLTEVRRERLERLIRGRIRDPLFNPARAAAALGVSVRQVHALFAPTGTSFGEYLMARRLDAAFDDLLTREPGRSVADVAYDLGFNTLSTFYRAFRGRYGLAPGDVRPV